MRNLLFALLLANLAMLAFRYWVAEPPRGESLQPRDVPRLELAQGGEREARRAFPTEQQPAEVLPDAAGDALDESPPQQAAARAPLRCVAVGPFSELRASDLAARALREQGFNPERQAEEGQVWMGYWVRAGFAGRDDARLAVERLREGEVPDAYVIPGEEGFTVSLGLFNQRDRAERLRTLAAQLGVAAELRDRYSDGTVYWLLLEVPAEASVSQPVRGGGARDAGVEERDCGTA